ARMPPSPACHRIERCVASAGRQSIWAYPVAGWLPSGFFAGGSQTLRAPGPAVGRSEAEILDPSCGTKRKSRRRRRSEAIAKAGDRMLVKEKDPDKMAGIYGRGLERRGQLLTRCA